MNARFRNALGHEIAVGIRGRREQQIRKRIRDDAVDLFRHRAVAAAESGFDVPHGDAEFRGNQRSGYRRIHVAVNEDQVRPLREARLLEAFHDGGGLLRVGAGADFEVVLRMTDAEVLEERIGHVVIVVLAGVHDHMLDIRTPRQLPLQRRELHEVGTGADDGEDPQGA